MPPPRSSSTPHAAESAGAGTSRVENLGAQGMTRSTNGAVENPGRNVKQKAGLNREVLRSGRHGPKAKFACKRKVAEVDPACASQTCKARGLPPSGQCRPECGPQHSGAGDRRRCAARAFAPAAPITRETAALAA
ncbi:MAG: hypothetical protein OXN84_06970 [Albidovulum sp.]|nr:hypothetical protein [Albidovulum sp.]